MRYVYLILFALVLGVPFALRRAAMRGEEISSSQAGALRLVVVTVHDDDIRREFAHAFDAWYRAHYGQGAVLDFRVPGGTSDMVHYLKGQPPGIDVVWGGGDYTYYHILEPAGLLQPMRIDPTLLHAAFAQDDLAGVRLYDATKDPAGNPTPQWVGVCLSSFGIIYNPQLYAAMKLPPPTAWGDLTDPKLFGFVALADPAHSGSAQVAYMMVIQRAMADGEDALFAHHPELRRLPPAQLKQRPDYIAAISAGWKRGMGQLLLIAANARYFSDSSTIVPTDVGRAEAAAGMAIDFYARVTEETLGSDRARFVAPRAATAITPDAVAILRGVSGDRLTLATRFVEFLLSRQGQRLWILSPGQPNGPVERSLRRMPIRRDVYADQTGWAAHFDPFAEAGGFNQRGTWMALMSDTLPIWQAAWIDSRDALLDSYQNILRVQDPARRSRLLTELADLPITMQDVEAYRAKRIALTAEGGDVYQWQASQQIELAERFRKHYARVR